MNPSTFILYFAGVYLIFGAATGLLVVWLNLARFHGAGFQWKRMAKHAGLVALIWPIALVGLVAR